MVLSAINRIAIATLGLALSATTVQGQQPIRIGAIYILSGTAATYGEFARQGIDLAVEEINADGGILGRPVTFVVEDSEAKSAVAIQKARRLVYEQQVDVLVGLDSSGVATGVVPIVPELQKPLIITHAATPDVTGRLCNRFVFRNSVNINQNVQGAAIVAAEQTDARRWTTIGPDYAFGRQSWDYFQQYMKAQAPEAEFMDEVAFPPFGAGDYVPFINRIMAAEPEGILISLWGGDLVNFVRQADNLGFFDRGFEVFMTVGAATEVLTALGERMPEGVWLGTRYWFAARESEINQKFVAAYRERFGVPPSYNAEGAYSAVYTVKAAMEKAGSSEASAVIDALEGLTVETPAGPRHFRPGDHQAVLPANWGKAAGMTDMGIRALEPLFAIAGERVTPPVAETGCQL
ncbi:MAG: ABC transporter substrate-binding protein [Candidatus Competibacterales bacterium]